MSETHKPQSRPPTAGDYLDAIRLAVAAPTNSRHIQTVIEELLASAPGGRRGTEPVSLFLHAIRNVMPMVKS